MNLLNFQLWATILLVNFVVSTTIAGFLAAVPNPFWIGFLAFGLSSLVASWIVGNE